MKLCTHNKSNVLIPVGFSTLYNVDTTSVSDIETILNQRCTTSIQPLFNVAQRCFNVNVALSQRSFNVASMSVKAMSKPIWLVKKMGLHKD